MKVPINYVYNNQDIVLSLLIMIFIQIFTQQR